MWRVFPSPDIDATAFKQLILSNVDPGEEAGRAVAFPPTASKEDLYAKVTKQ